MDDNRVCRGICAMDLRSMEVVAFPAEAVIIATGGNGAIFGKSTNSVVCTGSAQSALYQQGAYYANGEFIQVHPTCIPGEDKLRLMSESARGEAAVMGSTQSRRPAIQKHSRKRSLVLLEEVPEVRQPGATRHRDPRHSQSTTSASMAHRWFSST
jgi:succinate dehydrogenase/fumarate reductase flavoprotein subunit